MTDPGNAAQVRAVAEQLFDVWRAEQASEGQKQRASWPAWIGVGIAVVGLIFSAGMVRTEMATATTRIDKLEQRADARDAAEKAMMDRLARIETKLDMALEERKATQ